jgi:hypothetical protein
MEERKVSVKVTVDVQYKYAVSLNKKACPCENGKMLNQVK